MAAFCPVHNKRWSELLANQPHGKVEAYRIFNRNDKVIPEFGPFNTVEDVTSYLKTKYADQLSLREGQLYIKTGGSYETYLKNISFIRKSIGDINKVYHDLVSIDIQPINKPAEKFGIGRSKKAIVTINQPALDSHYSVYNTPNVTEDDAQRRAEGNWRVTDEGDIIPDYEQRIDYQFRLVTALQNLQRNRFTTDKLQGWLNDLQKQGIPKEQIELFKESAKDGMTKDEIIASIAASYSYTVEANTSKLNFKHAEDVVPEIRFNENGDPYAWGYRTPQDSRGENTSFYSNLSAPGDTNGKNKYEDDPDWEYQELAIQTPDIINNNSKHSEDFSKGVSNMLGWARVWYNKKTGVVEIQEIQSALFQEGRDKDKIVNWQEMAYDKGDEKTSQANEFLQLLNKDSNWVTFFIKSIIQDSAKKGYEKVLFPKGETAAKVEGHETIANELQHINEVIGKEQQSIERKQELRNKYKKELLLSLTEMEELFGKPDNNLRKKEIISLEDDIEYLGENIRDLEKRKSELKSQGIEKLKPIEAFYEIKVGNILKKIDPNVKTITDEYGNEWWEYTIQPEDQNKQIQLQKRSVSEQLTPEERTDFEQKKVVMMKVFPRIKQVIEDYNIPQAGLLEGNGTIIRVNPLYMTRDTIGHEFGHLLIDLMGGMENPMIRAAREKLRGSPLEKRVLALYSDLIESDPDRLDKEVLAQAIGEETAKIFDTEADQNWWERFLMRFFDWLKRKLGIEKNEVRELARMVVGQRSIPYVVDPTIDESYEARVRNYDVVDEVYVSETEKLRRKALDSLKMKYSIYHRKDLPQKAEAIGDTLAKLEGLKDDPIGSLKVFQEFAAEQTDAIYKQFKLTQRQKDYRKNLFAFKVRTLARWKDYVTSFDLLEEIVSVTRNAGASYIEGTEKLAEALNLDKLNETIQRKNEIQKAYKDEGLDLMVEFLLPHSTHIQAKYREIFEREYNKLPKDERKKITVEEYISQKLETSETDLSKETRLALRKELITAYGDVSQLTRWLDNMIDTPDLVTSAMVKAFAETDRRARQRQIEFKHELLDKQKKLEAFRSKGMFTKDEDFYDFFLERDEKGNLSGYSVDPYYNYMWSEYHKYGAFLQKKYEEGLISYDVMLSQKSNWKTENAPLNRKEFNKAKKEYLDQLLKDGYISAEERKALRLNDEIAKAAKRDRSLAKKIKRIDQIVGNDESAKMISTWVNENIPLFREPNKSYRFMFNEKTGRMERKEGGWLNPQWTKLVKIAGGNPNDPINKQLESVKANKTNDARIEFYNFIMAKNEEMQKNLPYMHRLRNRLPAIMKDFNQRLKAGDNIAELLKGTVKRNLAITSEYEERGERTQLTDESDNPVFFLPIYYTGDLDIKDQSFDVADIYFKYFSMAIDYAEKSTILPEMEMARFFVNDRDVFERDSKGNIVKKAVRGLRDRELTKKGYKSMIAAQLNDWFESVVYGKKTKDEGKISLFGAEVDFGRAIDMLNRYTALNLLGANFIQGTANVLLGSSLQLIESVGKEHYTPKNLAKANGYYFRQMPGILGDIGLREPENVVNLLNEKFDTLNEWIGTDFRKNTKFRQLMNTNTLFFTSHAGEHYMQTKAMLAMLDAMQAKDDKGNVLGSMMDVAKVKDGKLVFEGKNGEKVVNFDEKAQFEFESKLKRLLSRLHGEYSEMGMVAIQRYALGRMGYMFRKFIVPGFRRRWGSKYVNNFSGDFTEGNYRTFGRFMSTMMKDLGVFRLSMWQTNWQELTRMEKANVIRTIGEMAFLATAIIMASVFTNLKSKGGDDDEDWLYSFLGYQAMRLRAELAFFVMPNQALLILRSPAASMSVIENTIKLFGQMLDPVMNGDLAFERYERGNWKGQLKINRTLVNFVPAVKQMYRLRDVSDQLNWLRQ